MSGGRLACIGLSLESFLGQPNPIRNPPRLQRERPFGEKGVAAPQYCTAERF